MGTAAGLLECRDSVLERLRRDLMGPAEGESEILVGKPTWRYMTGILFPSDAASILEEERDEIEPGELPGPEEQSDTAIGAAYDLLPASMGITFYSAGAQTIEVACEGARYEPVTLEQLVEDMRSGTLDGERASAIRSFVEQAEVDPEDRDAVRRYSADIWLRRPLGTASSPATVRLNVPAVGSGGQESKKTLDGRATVLARFRPVLEGHLVTVTLVNQQRPNESAGAKDEVASTLFQCRFRVHLAEGSIGKYPEVGHRNVHPEDEELDLVYASRRSHGIGHGCAATWRGEIHEGRVRSLAAEPLPYFEVRGITNSVELHESQRRALDLRWLAETSRETTELRSALDEFVSAYEAWSDRQASRAERLPEGARDVASRLVERQRIAVRRMRRGIDVLCRTRGALDAFRLAQEAMLRQFAWVNGRKGGPFDRGEGRVSQPDPMRDRPGGSTPQWYPFQLAFQLLVLESLIDPDSTDRELLDLLWFPTGGGKTEAYLALAAFEMIQRRIRYHDAGTAVIMRYTLRLLTSQQFERCATLISVLETMRQEREALLGDEPFRLGLWVGGALTPNQLDSDNDRAIGARQWVEQLMEQAAPENPFLLRNCPQCGTRIVPREQSAEAEAYGVRASASGFLMWCPDERCVLHSGIPVSVVDDDLYEFPPTFLIGTVDKFARMVWEPRSRRFLGGGQEGLAPSLIIQDELHLINGPLGSIAGGYEAGIEAVIRERGRPPKYLAATATIQRSAEQAKALYGRHGFLFPPSGIDASDSFFSREDEETPGRTFLGVMGNGLYSSLTSLIQASASAAHAPQVIPARDEIARDTYWTQVIYHNSRQELGKTTTMLRDDVRTRLELLEPSSFDRRPFDLVEELSANLKGTNVAEALERLQISYPHEEVVDAVACTNMISVGVDIGRLGLMIVKGQPKTTAEYIQATSRVGRDAKRRPPGIVMSLYSPFRPRDRSHYEGFQAYHQALYRAVEPTTVTPYSAPARDRTLHAGLVLALRHAMGWEQPRQASEFDPEDPVQASVISTYEERVLRACPEDERTETRNHLRRLVKEWADEAKAAKNAPLSFASLKQFRALLTTFPRGEGSEGLWPTLNSMRHVDGETPFEVRGEAEDQRARAKTR